MNQKATFVTVVFLLSLAVAVHQSASQVFATTPNDQLAINVTGTLASNNGIAMSPLTLTPAFNTATTDYVLSCQSGVNVQQITLSAASGSLTVSYQGSGGGTVTQSGSSVTVEVALGENQAVELVTTQAGTAGSYSARCLPHDFPRLSTTKGPGTASMPGWYLTSNITSSTTGPSTSTYAMVEDQNGTPVWYQRFPQGPIDVTLLNNTSTLAWAEGDIGLGSSNPLFMTYDLSTQTAGQLKGPLPNTDAHELQQLTSGPFSGDDVMIAVPVVTGLDLSALPDTSLRSYTAIADCVVEIFNPSTDALDWSWDAWRDGHIGPDESQDPEPVALQGTNAVDMYHCNSVDVDGTNVLVSSRHMSALFDVAIDPGKPDDKTVRFKLGGNNAVPASARHIIPSKDPEGTFSGQHDARIQSLDTTGEPAQVSLYDDHTFSGDQGIVPGGARGSIYNLNIAGGTAEFLKQYPMTNTQVAGIATGSFRIYEGGTDILVGWGFRSGGSGFTEFDGNGNVVLNQTFPNGELNYRVVKVPLSALSLSALRQTAGLPRASYPSSTAWTTLPSGLLTSGPALTTWSSTRYDLFGRGQDGELWHAYWTGSAWSDWQPLGGQIVPGTGPAAVAWAPNRIDIFVEGLDSELWHLNWDGSTWSVWEPLGGALSASPAVASWGADRLDVIARGIDHSIWHMAWQGAWTAWESLGGTSASSPGADSFASNRIDIITQGLDGGAWHQFWGGSGWSGWIEDVGGKLSSGPAVASEANSELDVVAAGQGVIPERLTYLHGWQLWQPLPQSPMAQAALTPQTAYSPALVALGSNAEESCLTVSSEQIECAQLSAGVSASPSAPPAAAPGSPGPVSPKVMPNI